MLITPRYQLSIQPFAIVWLLVVLAMFCLVSPALASLSGEAELVYSDHSIEQDGEEKKGLSTFAQNYSVYYDKKGFIGDRRFGNYAIGLGYQWSANSTTTDSEKGIGDVDSDSREGKILFNGDVTIDPGALPFYFNAYSFDLSRPTYSYARTGEILDTNVIVGSRSREEIRSGMSLIAGIRNGSYLGAHRKILSKLPRVFIDYSQVYLRDLDGSHSKEHSLGRDLAFVSLNKKDNWFHYRAYDYKDYLDSTNNLFTHTFLLGTVDQMLKRQWINLTNWIKFSADGSFTEEDSQDDILSGADPKTFSVNLFANAEYDKTHIYNYSNFRRTADSDKLAKDYEIPFYANGWIDPNRSWSLQLQKYAYSEYWFNQNSDLSYDEEGDYLAGRLGVGHISPFKFDSTLELERGKKRSIQTYAVRVRNEISRNVAIGGRNPWLLGYSAVYISNSGNDDDLSSTGRVEDVFENELYGSYQWAMSSRNSLDFRQNFRYAGATADVSASRFIYSKGYAESFDNRNPDASSKALYVSETSVDLESRLKANLTNRLRFVANIYRGGSGDKDDVSIIDNLRYKSGLWRFEMMNGIYLGDDPPDLFQGGDIIVSGSRGRGDRLTLDVNYIIGHRSVLEYFPNRHFKSKASFNFALSDTDQGKTYESFLDETSEYVFLSLSGRKRVTARVYQAFKYEKYSSDFADADYLEVKLGGSYYPFSTFELSGELIYKAWDPQGVSVLELSTMAALSFPELTCEARYSYGVGRISDELYDERKEHLFEAKVIKTF